MAAIYLIRHGQASFGKADYDQLSELGSKQSKVLGEHWQCELSPSKAYAGDLLRHGQTLEHFTEGLKNNNTPVVIHSGMNEFNHVDILQKYNADWSNFAQMSAEINQLDEPNKTFQKEFSLALNRWVSGEFDEEYQESWSQFKLRCIRALQDIILDELLKERHDKNANSKVSPDILVFTSGGTISVILQHVLQLSDEQTLKVNQQLRNTSVSKLLFSQDNISVDYFNNYNHLTRKGSDWVTFR